MTVRTLIRLDGVLEGAWAIGAGGTGDDANLPLLVNPLDGSPQLASTTLVGALRDHLGDDAARAWLGPGPDEKDPDGQPLSASQASALWALGAVTTASSGDCLIDQRTAIDPARRAATGQTLRTEKRVVPAGEGTTRFRWALQHAGQSDEALLVSLAGWRCRIGARQTVGLGRLRVTRVEAVTIDLGLAEQLTWWLANRGRWLREPTGSGRLPLPTGVVSVVRQDNTVSSGDPWRESWTWRIVDSLHVGSPLEAPEPEQGSGQDRTGTYRAVRRSRQADQAPEVPGSSWKGVFRHRCEFILRALDTADDTVDTVIGVLFGANGDGPAGRRRGVLMFDSSVLTGAGSGRLPRRTHVAIDRITGGAAEKRLFTVESVDEGTVPLTVGASDALPGSVVNLLRHVVRDLHDGLIGIGGSTTRGYGTIGLTSAPPATAPVDVPAITAWAQTKLDSAPGASR